MIMTRTKWGKAVLWEDASKAFRRANVLRLMPDAVPGFEKGGRLWMWLYDFEALMGRMKSQRDAKKVSKTEEV